MNENTTLVWGIKESLLRYVEGLSDGAIVVSNSASRVGNDFEFTLDLAESDYDADSRVGTLQFRGSVLLTGYEGAMRVEIKDPQLYLKGDVGGLALKASSIFTGERFEGVALVEITTYEPELQGTPKLTPSGPIIFGPQYQAGQELDVLRVRW